MSVSDEYLAGLIDGEGSVEIMWCAKGKSLVPRFRLVISIVENDPSLDLVNDILFKYGGCVSETTQGRYQKQIRWYITEKESLYNILTNVLPFLYIKREVVLLMLEALKFVGIKGKREGWYNQWSKEDILNIADIGERLVSYNIKKSRRVWTKEYIKNYLELREMVKL